MPEDLLSGEGSEELGKADALDILNDDNESEDLLEDKKSEKKAEKKIKANGSDDEDDEEGEEESEEDIELEDENEEEEDSEEEEQLVTPVRMKEVIKKYPNIQKEFPHLFTAYQDHKKFVEVFPTPEDAQEALDKAEAFDKFEASLGKGDLGDTLKAVKESDPKAFGKIVDNYLETLERVDEKAYFTIASNVVKQAIYSIAREAKDSNNSELLDAVAKVHKSIFGNTKVTPAAKYGSGNDKDNEQNEELENERRELARERYETARDGLQKKVDSLIMSTISTNIDPKQAMDSFVKKHASKEAFDKLEQMLINDRSLEKQLTSLWKSAESNKYNNSSLEKIRTAFLSKVKVYLPSAIKMARVEALKGNRKRSSSDESEEKDKRGPIPPGRSSSSDEKRGKTGKIPEGMSIRDYMMSD